MFQEYLSVIVQRDSNEFVAYSRIVADCLLFGIISHLLLSMENKWVKRAVNLYLTLFTGTPLLVQFF